MDKNKAVVLPEDSASARFEAVVGWISRDGFFFGRDEWLARRSGSTHVTCAGCGKIIEKNSYCHDCHRTRKSSEFLKMERRIWNGTDLIYSQTEDEFFCNPDELEEYCYDNDLNPRNMELVICEPVYAEEILPWEHYESDLPEDGECPSELEEIFNELNQRLREEKIILSWRPGRFAVDCNELSPTSDHDAQTTSLDGAADA